MHDYCGNTFALDNRNQPLQMLSGWLQPWLQKGVMLLGLVWLLVSSLRVTPWPVSSLPALQSRITKPWSVTPGTGFHVAKWCFLACLIQAVVHCLNISGWSTTFEHRSDTDQIHAAIHSMLCRSAILFYTWIDAFLDTSILQNTICQNKK